MPEFTVFQGSRNGTIVEARTQRPYPSEHEVLVRITHSGICGTDEHYVHSTIVLGHEGTGAVDSIGSQVTSLCASKVVCPQPEEANRRCCGLLPVIPSSLS